MAGTTSTLGVSAVAGYPCGRLQLPSRRNCWYETDYSVCTMREVSRRSWRIGQSEPVQVVFMASRSTIQADALKLVAQKFQSSLAVEGELPEDGLAAYGDDLLIALARKIVAGEEDAGSVESVFEQARQVAAETEALLVTRGWHAPEPVAAGVDGAFLLPAARPVPGTCGI